MTVRLTVSLPDHLAEFVREHGDNQSAFVAEVLEDRARRERLDRYFEENERLGVNDAAWMAEYFADLEAVRASTR